MKRKFLEDLGLTKEQIDSVMSENGRDIEYEKEKATSVQGEVDNLKTQLQEANTTITDLKKSNGDNEVLQAKVTEYENTMATQKAEYEEKMKNITLDTAIEKALTKANAKHSDLLTGRIDKSKLVIKEDNVEGLEEQIKDLQDNYKDLFVQGIKGREPNNAGGSPLGVKNPWSKEYFNLTNQAKILKENPELANQFKNSI